MEKKVLYFEKFGKENTEACLQIVRDAIDKYKYRFVIVASVTGETGLLFSKALKDKDVKVVVVTHSAGYKLPNTFEMPEEIRREIENTGAKIYTGTMLTHSLETSFTSKFSGIYPTLIVAHTLRRFGEGTKVCCEITMMAADGGLIPENEKVLAVAGTASGADTVLVLQSAASKRFLDLKVLEILAKPIEF
ncbi:MAG: hypothetical protein N3A59_01205 [Thermodesulfovibrionales bacterium]|nr:hypothetical protein [Thermodesulfovibrionales bacterium]